MPFSKDEFIERWKQLGENDSHHSIDTAWRRFQTVQDTSYYDEPEERDPSASDFRSCFKAFLDDVGVRDAIADHRFISLPANRIPFTATGLHLKSGQSASTFSSGRVWRSRELDLFLRPQFAIWFKVGINGTVFNSTGNTNTFQSQSTAELYVANQFPGQFGEPCGGRLASPLSVYDKADGNFEILVILWKENVNAQGVLEKFNSSSSAPTSLVSQELDRIRRDAHPSVPEDWKLLWFLGTSSIYSLEHLESEPCMHCKPYQNTGILQKNLEPPVPFKAGTNVSWDWIISSLPSRLREDLTITHDYLSIAFEFENGRDLTYTWSWELPKNFGYWCPLPSWADREYHIVIRSGTGELGQWIGEERDLYADYVKYIEEGEEDRERMPKQIVRTWFIAGNRWQRFDGEMRVKRIRIHQDGGQLKVL